MKTYKSILSLAALAIGLTCATSCDDDDYTIPYTRLDGSKIVVNNIQGVPNGVHIEYLSANIQGKRQKVVDTVKGFYDGENFVIELPGNIDPDLLIASQWNVGEFLSGFWPAVSSDPTAGVAHLADILAYNGDDIVGRVFLTDWAGTGDSYGNAFIYYHYADSEFTLSGNNLNVYQSPSFKPSYFYKSPTFKPGWNVYANINPSGEGVMTCTTDIPKGLNLQWRFEAW